MLVAAAVTLDANEAVLEETAAQIFVELPGDERGQRGILLCEAGAELGQPPLDYRVQCRLLRLLPLVTQVGTSMAGHAAACGGVRRNRSML